MEEVEKKTKIVTLGRADSIELKETVQRLAVAQERTEHRMEKLAEAQKRTDRQFEKMAEAQKKMDQAMKEMAQAQKETARTLKKYVVDHEIVKKQLGGLTMSPQSLEATVSAAMSGTDICRPAGVSGFVLYDRGCQPAG